MGCTFFINERDLPPDTEDSRVELLKGGQLWCRKEHFSPQTLDSLAELPPERGEVILKTMQERQWRDIPNSFHAVWVAVKHFK